MVSFNILAITGFVVANFATIGAAQPDDMELGLLSTVLSDATATASSLFDDLDPSFASDLLLPTQTSISGGDVSLIAPLSTQSTQTASEGCGCPSNRTPIIVPASTLVRHHNPCIMFLVSTPTSTVPELISNKLLTSILEYHFAQRCSWDADVDWRERYQHFHYQYRNFICSRGDSSIQHNYRPTCNEQDYTHDCDREAQCFSDAYSRRQCWQNRR